MQPECEIATKVPSGDASSHSQGIPVFLWIITCFRLQVSAMKVDFIDACDIYGDRATRARIPREKIYSFMDRIGQKWPRTSLVAESHTRTVPSTAAETKRHPPPLPPLPMCEISHGAPAGGCIGEREETGQKCERRRGRQALRMSPVDSARTCSVWGLGFGVGGSHAYLEDEVSRDILGLGFGGLSSYAHVKEGIQKRVEFRV
jgi:hypothetical protein